MIVRVLNQHKAIYLCQNPKMCNSLPYICHRFNSFHLLAEYMYDFLFKKM